MRAPDKQGLEVYLASCRESGTTCYDMRSEPHESLRANLYTYACTLPYTTLWRHSDSAFNKKNSIIVKFLADSDRWHYSSTGFGASFRIPHVNIYINRGRRAMCHLYTSQRSRRRIEKEKRKETYTA
jgi:hypothetical protein